MKFKEKWPTIKENISNALRCFLLAWLMTLGWWLSYALVWFAVGLPQTDWALWLLFGLASASEVLYIRWLMEQLTKKLV